MCCRSMLFFLLVILLFFNSLPAQEGSLCFKKEPSHHLSAFEEIDWVTRYGGFSGFFKADKAQHCIGSAISTIFLTKLSFKHLRLTHQESKKFAVITTIGLGVLKEVFDKNRPNNFFSWRDLCANGLGVVVGIIIVNQP